MVFFAIGFSLCRKDDSDVKCREPGGKRCGADTRAVPIPCSYAAPFPFQAMASAIGPGPSSRKHDAERAIRRARAAERSRKALKASTLRRRKSWPAAAARHGRSALADK